MDTLLQAKELSGHTRQGRELAGELYVVAVAALVSIGVTLTILLRYPKWSRVAALAQGVATIVGLAPSTPRPTLLRLSSSSSLRAHDVAWFVRLVGHLAAWAGRHSGAGGG